MIITWAAAWSPLFCQLRLFSLKRVNVILFFLNQYIEQETLLKLKFVIFTYQSFRYKNHDQIRPVKNEIGKLT